MAILIDKQMDIMGGIPVSQIYLRLQYMVMLSGKWISCSVFPYYNKESFLGDENTNIIHMNNLKINYDFSYDSEIDGDILPYLHEKIKEYLSTDIYRKEIALDPSTGEIILDPSTGLPVYYDVLVKAKFADASEISFVDLD